VGAEARFLEQVMAFGATRDGVEQFLRRKGFGQVITGRP
jgi:hypothetical protein